MSLLREFCRMCRCGAARVIPAPAPVFVADPIPIPAPAPAIVPEAVPAPILPLEEVAQAVPAADIDELHEFGDEDLPGAVIEPDGFDQAMIRAWGRSVGMAYYRDGLIIGMVEYSDS